MDRVNILTDSVNITLNLTEVSDDFYNATTNYDYFDTVDTAVFGTWLVAIIICAIIGNLFVILVILLDKDMRHVKNGTNLFLFNLALSDISVGLLVAPVSLYTLIYEDREFNETVLCTIDTFLIVTFVITSVHILMYISIHKYLSVKRLSECVTLPVSKFKCYFMIGGAWLWGVIFAFLTTVVLSEAQYKPKTMQCGPKYPVFTVKNFTLSLGTLIVNFIVPLVIIIVMYMKIYYIMKNNAEFHRESVVHSENFKSGEKAVINTLIIVLSCYIVCWIPYNVYVCYTNVIFYSDEHAERSSIPVFLNPLVYCCGFTNSVCNPIIYAFRFPDFRKGYLHILRNIFCLKSDSAAVLQKERHRDTKSDFHLVPTDIVKRNSSS